MDFDSANGFFPEEQDIFETVQLLLYISALVFFSFVFLIKFFKRKCAKLTQKNIRQNNILDNLQSFYEINKSEGFKDDDANEDLFDFSDFLCGCSISNCIILRRNYNSRINQIKNSVLLNCLARAKVFGFFFNTMIFFNKPLEGLFFWINNNWLKMSALKIFEILFSSLDFFYIIFMISFIGNRRELLKLYQEGSECGAKLNRLMQYFLRKAIKFTCCYLVFIFSVQYSPWVNYSFSVLGDDEDSLLFYIFRNIFFLFCMNYGNCINLEPITNNNNDPFKKSEITWTKIRKFSKEITPSEEFVSRVIALKRIDESFADLLIGEYFRVNNLQAIHDNFIGEIEDINDMDLEAIIYPIGYTNLAYVVLFLDIFVDHLISIIFSLMYLLWRSNHSIFLMYKIISCFKIFIEMFIQTCLVNYVIKTSILYEKADA